MGVDVSGAAWPARFEIRLDRLLEPRWSEWFGGLEVESDADETILRGTKRDRSVLQGLLDKAADLGLSVHRCFVYHWSGRRETNREVYGG
jgi:hypothetical protein